MTSINARLAPSALALVVALAAGTAVYAQAPTQGASGGWMSRMISGCGGMMGSGMMRRGAGGGNMKNGGMAGGGMMGGGMMGGGMMGDTERPNQQWRR